MAGTLPEQEIAQLRDELDAMAQKQSLSLLVRLLRRSLITAVPASGGTAAIPLAVGALTVIALVLMEHLMPRAPAPLIAVAAAITAMNVPTGLTHLTLPNLELAPPFFPGLLALRTEGRMYFANAQHIGSKMQALIKEAHPRVVLLDMGGVFDLEYTALKMLVEAEKRLRDNGTTLWLARLNPSVWQVIQRSSLGETLGRDRMFMDTELAIARYQASA